MNSLNRKFFILLLMLLASASAQELQPKHKIADDGPKINLETMIPERFGDWQIDKTIIPIQVSPDVKEQLDKLYSQLLSKTYVNSSGEKVMLSISYGGNQGNDELQVHRPEYCYVAQGFELQSVYDDTLNTSLAKIAVRRLVAMQGARHEPITYWVTVGDKITLPGLGRKIAQLSYGLTGKIPDGMLVRVSSINNDRQSAYHLQDVFINDLLNAINPVIRTKMLGKL